MTDEELNTAHEQMGEYLEERAAARPMPAHFVEVGGQPHMRDVKGRLVPVENIPAVDQLMDETVRKIAGFTIQLRDQIRRYKQHTLDDVLGFKQLLAQEHRVTVGGEKGNITLTTFDGLMKVTVKVADLTFFGPELQDAKTKVSECLRTWSADSRPELRAIVEAAFAVDQEGRVNRSDLLYLLRLQIDDPLWNEAMDLIRKAERPIGSKEYVQVHVREKPGAKWEHVAIDVAAA